MGNKITEAWKFLRCTNNVRNIILFATNRCCAKCKMCGIWEQRPKVDIPPDVLEDNLFRCKSVSGATISLTGGEFVMHPKASEIVSLCREHDLNINITTNGILTDKIEKIVKKFEIRDVRVSLDGKPDTHNFIRGVNCYSNAIETIKRLKDFADVRINYTVCPWNSKEDFLHVLKISSQYGIKVGVVVYEDVKAFDTKFAQRACYDISDLIEDKEERDFFLYYFKWLNGFRLPCLSIRNITLIMPNGDVLLCHCKNIILGNIHEQTFDEIWYSKKRKEIVKRFTTCNDCWGHCHRIIDLAIYRKYRFLVNLFKVIR